MVIHQVTTRGKQTLESLNWCEFTWVNIEKPTEEVKEYLSQNYPFHELDLDDCLSRIQRSKIDEYKEYLFLVLHFPVKNKESGVTEPSQVSVFVGDNYLITLHDGQLKPLAKFFHDIRDSEELRQKTFNQGSAYLLYGIIDKLVDYCFPLLNQVGENIDSTENSIFSNGNRTTVKEISLIRRDVISLRRIIGPLIATVRGLEPIIRRYSRTDLTVYVGDTIDHLDKIWDVLEAYKEVIEGLNSTYDSLSSERVNDILRILTILATIGTTLTVIASFFGMNIPLPGGANPGGHAFSWIILLVLMLWIIASMLFYFRRKGWV